MDTTAKVTIIIIFLVLSLGIFSYIMNESLFVDEKMYVTAGVLAQEYAIYTEFSYLQMPYLPLLYGAVFQLTETEKYTLTARLLNVVFTFLSMIFVFLIAYKLSGDIFVSIASFLFFVFNEILIYTMGYAWNAVMPITYSLIGIYLFIISIRGVKVSALGIAAGGLFIALAAGTKLYYSVLFIPFIVVACIYPNSFPLRYRFMKILLPLIVGYIIGSLPVLYYVVRDFDVFWFNNIGFHFIDKQTLTGVDGMSIFQKFQVGLRFLGQPTTLIISIGVLFLSLQVIRFFKDVAIGFKKHITIESVLLILLLMVAIPATFIGTPVHEHYIALPLPLAILLIPALYAILPAERREGVQLLLVSLVVVAGLYGGPQLYGNLDRLAAVNKWEPNRVHTEAQELREYIGKLQDDDKVATLYPLYAVEAGLPVYKEFSSGTFLYHVGDLLGEEKRRRYVTTSPNTLADFFEQNPPKVLLLANLQSFDASFYEFVENHEYYEMERHFFGHTIFIKK